ncbi:HTH-type transcriptional regulator [Haemophilus parahaemolyticus HK385]|nr:transcriptional regulator, AraC family [Haemophilus parahaemolyticus HK385]STO65934.1 HTH-type transcriptional regulator [Haemophilus parahaemolyticus HK385]
MMDYLDKLTLLAQVQGKINIRCLFQGDWQVEHHTNLAQEEGIFHIIEQGECWLTLVEDTFHLKAGDLFFLPRNCPHRMQSRVNLSQKTTTITTSQGLFELRQIGQKSPDLKMFCGSFLYQKDALLIGALPDYLHFHLPETPVQPLLQLFLKEANETNQGSKSVIDALANVLFIYILRYALKIGWVDSSLLAAFEDKRLNQVLTTMLNEPQAEWNLEQLAEMAAMSRATFCRVFQQKMQMPPKRFLNQIRLQQGAYLLKHTPKSVLEVALEIGYQSEAHFSKAFKIAYGITPSQYRK